MSLHNAFGLFALLAIPFLILIYVIKQEHKEKNVSGTYIWHISERFLKKRLPLKRVSKLLAFILQLSMLAALGISAAAPFASVGGASGHIAIIDASASMRWESGAESRFSRAINEAKELINDPGCNSVSVIIAGDSPYFAVKDAKTENEAKLALDGIECGYGGSDIYTAMELARGLYSQNGGGKILLYTDVEYTDPYNVTVVDMKNGEKNIACMDLIYGGRTFTGTVASFGEDKDVIVGLKIDGVIKDTRTVSCKDGERVTVKFAVDSSNFGTAELFVRDEDGFLDDNSFTVTGKSMESVNVLVTGEDTFFIESALASMGNAKVTVKKKYEKSDNGKYELYIFHGNTPLGTQSFPNKGVSVGFLDLDHDKQLDGYIDIFCPFQAAYVDSYIGCISGAYESSPLLMGAEEELQKVYVKAINWFAQYNPNWHPVLQVSGPRTYPVCLENITESAYNYVFAFPVSQSNLALTPAFAIILNNALKLASPPVIESRCVDIGSPVAVNLPDGTLKSDIILPDNTIEQVKSGEAYTPDLPGIYTLEYEKSKQEKKAYFFARIPKGEYDTSSDAMLYVSNVSGGRALVEQKSIVPVIAAVILAVMLAEWGYWYRGRF